MSSSELGTWDDDGATSATGGPRRKSALGPGMLSRRRNDRDPGKHPQGVLAEETAVKARIMQLAITLAAIAAIALAGGATLKGF